MMLLLHRRRALLTSLLLVLFGPPRASARSRSASTGQDALGLDLDASAEARPVMKIVQLLEDMKQELEKEAADDKAVHEDQTCFCDTNEKEKTQAIEEGEASIEQLEASLGEAAATLGELKVKRKETKDELTSNIGALSSATALRMKDAKAFATDEKDTILAVKACKDAITVLSKHNTGLVEIRAVAANLQSARVLQMGMLDNLRSAALKDFLHDAQGATSFLSIPGFKSYKGRSGQIFGILEQMLEDFESHLSEIQEEETKAISDYKGLKAAKEKEIEDGKLQVIDLDKRLAGTSQKEAEDFKELGQTKTQVANDKKFLANLKVKCEEGATEYDTRFKDRLEETKAVEDTIAILNDEDSFGLFEKTLKTMFLQVASSEGEKEQQRRQSAAATLEAAAAHTDAPWIAFLAGQVRIDSFTKVKEAIEGMVTELTKQQKDEADHKDWCVGELNGNEKKTAAANDKEGVLSVKKEDLKKAISLIKGEIKATAAAVTEMKVQMKKASETREGANADYQQTINDQRLTQMVLGKAITRMKQVYALIDQVHRAKGPGAPNSLGGPAKFKKYEKNDSGNKVLSMLDGVMADSKKAEDDAIKAEQTAQSTYEGFMTDSNKALKTAAEKISTLSGNLAKAKEDALMTKKDLSATSRKLEGLKGELADLNKSCDFVIKNFSTRQSARAAEIDALNEAKGILSGAR